MNIVRVDELFVGCRQFASRFVLVLVLTPGGTRDCCDSSIRSKLNLPHIEGFYKNRVQRLAKRCSEDQSIRPCTCASAMSMKLGAYSTLGLEKQQKKLFFCVRTDAPHSFISLIPLRMTSSAPYPNLPRCDTTPQAFYLSRI